MDIYDPIVATTSTSILINNVKSFKPTKVTLNALVGSFAKIIIIMH